MSLLTKGITKHSQLAEKEVAGVIDHADDSITAAKIAPNQDLAPKSLKADFFGKFYDFIPWVSVDGFTVGGDTGYVVAAQGGYLRLYAAATPNYDARIWSAGVWYRLLDAGKVITIEFPIVYLFGTSEQNIWIRFAYDTADPPSETTRHFGWKIVGQRLWASNANGTTQTITNTGVDLTGAALSQRTRLKIVFTPGVDIKFYVNDVLVATHATNLPTNTDFYFHAHIRALAAYAREIRIGRILIEKEHA